MQDTPHRIILPGFCELPPLPLQNQKSSRAKLQLCSSRSTLTKLQAGAELKTLSPGTNPLATALLLPAFCWAKNEEKLQPLQHYRHGHFHWSGIMNRSVQKYNKQTSKNNNRSYFVISLSRTGGLGLVLIWIKPVGQALPCVLSLECESFCWLSYFFFCNMALLTAVVCGSYFYWVVVKGSDG